MSNASSSASKTDRDHVLCAACGALNRVATGRRLGGAKCGKCETPLAVSKPRDLTPALLARLRMRDQRPFLLDVWAPWCAPCRMMAPAFEAAAQRLAGEVRFFKLNSEDFPQAASDLGVRGIPALFLFDKGKLLEQRAGAMPAEAIEALARQALP